MKTKLILIKPATRNWLRALYIITKRKLRKINDEKLIVILCAAVFLLQLFIMVTAIAAPLHASAQDSAKQVPAKSAGLQIGDTRLNDTVGQARMKGLQIGQEVPDVTIANIINYKTPTAKFSDFKGKLLILDFWATWCAPCISMIPKMHELQKQFEGKVQFLSVTYQSDKEVLSFLKKLEQQKNMRFDLPGVTGDKTLRSMFPHSTLPHYVWIDAEGVLKAITEHGDVSAENISAFLAGQDVKAREKRYEPRIPYNEKKPLIVSGNGGDGRNLLYHSMLTGYTPGLGLGYSITTDSISGKKITGRNLSMAWLYKIAYSEGKRYFNDHNVVFDTKRKYDLTSAKHGEAYRDWLIDNHGFCYELLVPLALKSDAYKVMQQDLRRFFTSYDAELEKRKKECLILVRTSKTDKIASGGGTVKHQMDRFGWDLQNASLDNLIFRLNFNQVTSMPLLNETGYKGRVDLSIKAAFPDLEAVNRELKRYDLQFIKADREIEVLVISDRDPATSHQAVQ